jgi:hypothetical protein
MRLPASRGNPASDINNHGAGKNASLPVTRDTGLYNSIALTSDNIPVIAYFEQTQQCLWLINANDPRPFYGDRWNDPVQLTPAGSLTGQFVDIKIDNAFYVTGARKDRLHIVYYNAGNSTLEYLRGTRVGAGNNFSYSFDPPVTIDSTGVVGKWADVSLDANGNPYIAYLDMGQTNTGTGGYGALKMAFMPDPNLDYRQGQNWETMTVPLRYRGKDDRLSIECKPDTYDDHNAATLPNPNQTELAKIFWKAAIGYASDMYRIAYYVE